MALVDIIKAPEWLVTFKAAANNSVLRSLGSKLEDTLTVKDFGAIGDGVTDDAAAISLAMQWVSAAPNRRLEFPDAAGYRVASPIFVDFNGLNGMQVHMYGPLKPDAGIGDAFTIKNAAYGNFTLRAVGSGVNVANQAEFDDLPDYNTADPAGAQQCFVIDSCRAVGLDITANGYVGRVLRTKSTGTTKLSFLDIRIRTGDSGAACAQAMYLQGADSAFGCIQSAQTQWDVYGSVLTGLVDLTIVYWELGASSVNAPNPALTLKDIFTMHAGVIAGGQGSGNGTVLLVDGGVAQTIERLFTTQASVGLVVQGYLPTGSNERNHQLSVLSHYSYGTNSHALELNDVTNVTIQDQHYDAVGQYGVILSGACRGVRMSGYIRNPSTSAVYAAPGANLHRIHCTSRLYSSTPAVLVDLHNAAVQRVTFRDCDVNGVGLLLSLPSTNSVLIDGGTWGSTVSPLWDNRPNRILNTYTPVVESRGSSNFPAGSVSGATVVIPHGLGAAPTRINCVWSQLPVPGALLVVTAITDTTFTVAYVASTALSNQVNFRWTADANLA